MVKEKRLENNFDSGWIRKLESEDHWRLYWQQQKLMEGFVKPGDDVLEIGVGTGFTANYLKSKGVNVTTLDIDAEKKPDIVANIVDYEWPGTYDAVLAFQVFEHIPFDYFQKIIVRLKSRSDYLFFSVPVNEKSLLRLSFRVAGVPKEKKLTLAIPKNKITSKHHFWEIGHGCDNMDGVLQEHGFKILKKEKKLSRMFYALATDPLAKGR